MQKIFSLFIISILLFNLCACEKKSELTQNNSLKVLAVCDISGTSDGSFNQEFYNGINSFIAENPNTVVDKIETDNYANALKQVNEKINDYDVIALNGYYFENIADMAEAHSDKKFVLIDAYPINTSGEEKEFDNVYAIKFAEQESGFFAGAVAALETKTNKVAYVGGLVCQPTINFQYGFECGVKYINKKKSKNVEIIELEKYCGFDENNNKIGGNYIGSFSDTTVAKKIGSELLSADCDIIFSAAGLAGNSVIDTVKTNTSTTAMVIGCDTDQYELGATANRNVVLTSVIKVIGKNVKKALDSIKNNCFKGGNVMLYADSNSTGYIDDEQRSQLSENTRFEMEEIYKEVKAKYITPASTHNGITPDSFMEDDK